MHPAASFLGDVCFPYKKNPIFICSLPNTCEEGAVGERSVATREVEHIEGFAQKWDRAGRALYFCVSTLKPNARRRAKENVSELTGLHADIDFKNTIETPDEIRRLLRQLMLPPSKVNFSGNGLHAFWLFHEALEATPETIQDVERLLKLLADHVGGDPAVCEVARLLRLPGSHN